MLNWHDEHPTTPSRAEHYVSRAPTGAIWEKPRVSIVDILNFENGYTVTFELRLVVIIEEEHIDVNHRRLNVTSPVDTSE